MLSHQYKREVWNTDIFNCCLFTARGFRHLVAPAQTADDSNSARHESLLPQAVRQDARARRLRGVRAAHHRSRSARPAAGTT